MEQITRERLIEVCSNYKRLRYFIFNYKTSCDCGGECCSINEILPTDIHRIDIFESERTIIDINIYSEIENDDLETGILIRVLLHDGDFIFRKIEN